MEYEHEHDWVYFVDDSGQQRRVCEKCHRNQIVVGVNPAGETGQVGARSNDART